MSAYSRSTWILSVGLVTIFWTLFLSSHESKKTPKEYLSGMKNVITEWKPQLMSLKPSFGHDRPLILYAYSESDYGRASLGFFCRHGLHDAADFIFIFNGDTDADAMVPIERPNIKVIKRANECYDLGAYAEVLKANDMALVKKHKRFIMVNASVRGPFMPYWSNECWSDALLSRVTDKVKLVGLTYNCHSGQGHLQSSLWVTDIIGMKIMLTSQGIDECFAGRSPAIAGEVRMTPWIKSNGFDFDLLAMAYHRHDGAVRRKANNVTTIQNGKYESNDYALTDWSINKKINPEDMDPDVQPFYVGCMGEDHNSDKGYFGLDYSPWEIMFVKVDKGINPLMYDLAVKWVDGRGYSSYDFCK